MATGQGSPGRGGSPDHLLGLRSSASAVALATLGALAVALAPLLTVARAADDSQLGGQPLAAVAAALLALAAPVAAVALLREGRVAGAVGVLLGAGAVGLAAATADLQLLVGAIDANRLELLRPTTAAPLSAGPGAVVVLVGHLLGVVAAVVAGVGLRRSGVLDDPDAHRPGTPHRGGDGRAGGEGTAASRAGSRVVTVVVLAALGVAVGVLAPQLGSSDPVLLTPSPVGGPVLLAAAAVVLVVVVLVVGALALVSASLATAAGALAGVGLGVLALALPRLLAGLLAPRVSPGWGAVVTVLAALALVAAAAAAPLSARREPRAAAAAAPVRRSTPAAPALPSSGRAGLVAAVASLAAGLLAAVGSLLPAFALPDGVAAPQVGATRVVLLSAVLLTAVAAGVLVGGRGPGADLRPALGVLWAAVLLGAGGLGQAVVVGLAAPGVGVGAGPWLVGLALLLAAVGAGAAGVAGGLERDEVDTSALPEPAGVPRALAGLVVVGVVLAVALPVTTAPGFRAPSLLGGDPGATTGPGLDLWSLLVAGAAVAAAAAVGVASRRRRARAVHGSALAVVLVLGATWPLGPDGAVPGPGLLGVVLAVVGLGALLVVGGVVEPAPPPAPRRGRTPRAPAARGRR